MSAHRLVDDFFRHEYGRLVARLTREFGAHQLEELEDAAQSALMTAVESWPRTGPPDAPSAWLYRVAHNNALGALRRDRRHARLLAQEAVADPQDPATAGGHDDDNDLLRMLFVCCDERIPTEGQLVLALKTLCGFSTSEIAHRLLTTEANVYKRLTRARDRLRAHVRSTGVLDVSERVMTSRLHAVHDVLYVLFTEGHLSSHPEVAIRRELCDEAIRLTTLVAAQRGRAPETCALLALMHLHAARLAARQNAALGLLLLDEQDRAAWDHRQIELGVTWLAESARGDAMSRYHAEAGIAVEHCLASSLTETRWDRIVGHYEWLERLAPSPLHTLGRAVAVAEWQGAAAGLAIAQEIQPTEWLRANYQWHAVLADLHRRCGHLDRANRLGADAVRLAPNDLTRVLLARRLQLPREHADGSGAAVRGTGL
ncbi:MAG: sigma-70 family RNA polymerase sigma factor [Gemmatimonadaceae bacterium]